MTRLSPAPSDTPRRPCPPSSPAGRACPALLYQGQEFLFSVSTWFGSPEILLNLSFTFRTMANVSKKKAENWKLMVTIACKPSGSTFSCTTPRDAKSSYPGQAAWGARNMLFFQLCGTGNCPSRCSNLMGLSSLPEKSKHALNLEGLFISGRQQEKLKVHWRYDQWGWGCHLRAKTVQGSLNHA